MLVKLGKVKHIKQLIRALVIIKQIRNGEWTFEAEFIDFFCDTPACFRARREGRSLWLGWGAKYCEIEGKTEDLGRYGALVWHLAAKKKVLEIERGNLRPSVTKFNAEISEIESRDSLILIDSKEITSNNRKQRLSISTETEAKSK